MPDHDPSRDGEGGARGDSGTERDLERGKGLDSDGFIAREGSLGRVGAPFAPLVDDARQRVADTYGPRLHSVYLYGSVPRGTARPGRSDLDLLIALHPEGPIPGHDSTVPAEPSDADRAAAHALGAALDASYDVIDGAGILLYTAGRLLSGRERFDLGWFVACLCTPLDGEDLAARLPRYRPDSLLARETNGSLELRLPRWRRQNAAAGDPAERARLSRAYARHLVRTAFTLVMPRWGGWTSDLERSAEIFARYYPQRGDQLRAAAAVARVPVTDPAVLQEYADDLGPWLAAEYTRLHGRKSWPES
ncbi:nucleotidyltransferase domain-containing protein [Streptomyces sp. NBC_01497]|uniref:nucleotidyltransferase domain-containing protein n=1 Tax=Streptomyces sp. NBC_01497 TaxID=2903885 RepID=UPI002E2F06DE|nr:nucleotidyltransferase domain-containing protein [Streptomyces sp. NBC_01497]